MKVYVLLLLLLLQLFCPCCSKSMECVFEEENCWRQGEARPALVSERESERESFEGQSPWKTHTRRSRFAEAPPAFEARLTEKPGRSGAAVCLTLNSQALALVSVSGFAQILVSNRLLFREYFYTRFSVCVVCCIWCACVEVKNTQHKPRFTYE